MNAREAIAKLCEKDPEMPVFVLFGSDPNAWETALEWVKRARITCGVPHTKLHSAIIAASDMLHYEPKKIPD